MKKSFIIAVISILLTLITLFTVSCNKKEEEQAIPAGSDIEEETEKIPIECLKEVSFTFTHDDMQYVDIYEVPCLTAATETANAVNEKILSLYPEKVFVSSSNAEDDGGHDGCFVYTYKYDIFEKDEKKLAAILLEQNKAYFDGEYYDEYHAFYYDIINDSELTFDEYLGLLGSDRKTVVKNSIPFSSLPLTDDASHGLSEKLGGGIYGGEDDIILFYNNSDGKGSTCLTVPLSPIKTNKMTVTTNGSSLNLRKSPSSSDNSEILAKIPSGTELDVYSYYDEWMLVEYDGKYGYVSGEYLK